MAKTDLVREMDEESIRFVKDKIGELKSRIDSANYTIDRHKEVKVDFESRLKTYENILNTLEQVSKEK